MNRDEFLRRIDQINVWKSGGKRAPHKPLLLLLGLGRVLNGENRLASYRNDIEPELGQLLQRFGPPRKRMHPESPFNQPFSGSRLHDRHHIWACHLLLE